MNIETMPLVLIILLEKVYDTGGFLDNNFTKRCCRPDSELRNSSKI